MITMSNPPRIRDLTEVRVFEPERSAAGWAVRKRRDRVGPDGRLLIVAAEHPARLALGVRDNRQVMASRSELLERLATALSRPGVAYASWDAALDLPAVRGLVVGRALLFPQDGDVAAAVDIAAGLVRRTRS